MSRRGIRTTAVPVAARSIMASRREPPDSLDYFPTPPWATRALVEHLGAALEGCSAWEPACGEGHMAEVLAEFCAPVFASDIFDYGKGYHVGSFLSSTLDLGDSALCPFRPDWIITNPPFNHAAEFTHKAIAIARVGVALFVRTAWLESIERYHDLFAPTPPSEVAMFAERVALVKGRWDPTASTATSYSWVIWERRHRGATRLAWIPPGRRAALTLGGDIRRFAPEMALADFFEPSEADQ